MIKNVFTLLFLVAMVFTCVNIAEAYEPWGVGIYTETSEPLNYAVPGAVLGSKTGKATCKTVLSIINWGDCSVETAMRNGRISKVTAADWDKKYIIVYGEKTLKVHGN